MVVEPSLASSGGRRGEFKMGGVCVCVRKVQSESELRGKWRVCIFIWLSFPGLGPYSTLLN